MTRPGIEPRSPGPLANTLTPRPIVLKYNTHPNFWVKKPVEIERHVHKKL